MSSPTLGTARVILDGAGLVLSRLVYDSFGNLVNAPAIVSTFTFTGRDYDDASGLYNYRARWYDARNGIFISNDPIGFAAGDANLSSPFPGRRRDFGLPPVS